MSAAVTTSAALRPPSTGTPSQATRGGAPPARHSCLARTACGSISSTAGSNFNLTTGFNKSCDYLERVGTFFARSGVDVGFRIGRSPDADFKYFTTRVAAFVPTGGRYSELAADVGAKLGVAVLRVNQSDGLRKYMLSG